MYNNEFTMMRFFRIIWRHIIVIAIAGILCGAGGFAFRTYAVSDTYSSAVKLYVDTSSTDMSEYYQYTYATNAVQSYIAMLNSTSFFARISEATDPAREAQDVYKTSYDEDGNEVREFIATIKPASRAYTAAEISSMASFIPIEETDVFRLYITSLNREDAQILADACALLADTSIKAIKSQTSVNIVDSASRPALSNGNHTLYAALFGIIGLVVSTAIFVIVDLNDVTIKTEEDITGVYTLPLLGTVPDFDPENHDKKGHESYKYYYRYSKGASKK